MQKAMVCPYLLQVGPYLRSHADNDDLELKISVSSFDNGVFHYYDASDEDNIEHLTGPVDDSELIGYTMTFD